MDRRDALRTLALVPLIPYVPVNPVRVPQSAKSFLERAKYLEYTQHDFMKCRLIIWDDKGHRVWAPPIKSVVLCKEPFHVVMHIKHKNIKRESLITGTQFVDKDNRMLFSIRKLPTPTRIKPGDIFDMHYTIILD